MTLPWVAVHRRIWLLSKCCFNLRLCSLGNELILLGQMHENGRMKPIDLSQIFLSIGAVIPDRGVDAVVMLRNLSRDDEAGPLACVQQR